MGFSHQGDVYVQVETSSPSPCHALRRHAGRSGLFWLYTHLALLQGCCIGEGLNWRVLCNFYHIELWSKLEMNGYEIPLKVILVAGFIDSYGQVEALKEEIVSSFAKSDSFYR